MKTVKEKINIAELKQMAENRFGNFVKAVIDIEQKIMVVDAELHADEEALLIENGSRQENLWGINIYPELNKDEVIEFNSMINLKPRQNNRTRGVEDCKIREKILAITARLIEK
ncbi:hypothetical protein HZB07_06750 [Candidatus Saganbacteria bacterium]|nr:hypothetical protein [Candidatus Saganbacteria bacterium]